MKLFLSFFSVYLHFTKCLKDQLPSSETVLIMKSLVMFKSFVMLLSCEHKAKLMNLIKQQQTMFYLIK